MTASACDDDVAVRNGGGSGVEAGGTLKVVAADPIETLDPLHVVTRSERLASRQVYEPLRSIQRGPFGASRRSPGVAGSFRPNPDATIWTARLRRGVTFSNGDPLDADAVLVNADRWIGSAAGRARIPELAAADSPRPGRVRFLLDRPSRHFPSRLADPRFGLVAPAPLLGVGRDRLRLDASGTGPFEYRGHDGRTVLLARNASWWGTPLGLGPGVDQVELTAVAGGPNRVDALVGEGAEVADELGKTAANRVTADPLLTAVGGGGKTLGLERSVRGLDSAAAGQSLADVWLTDLR
jgi:peptide/nickel transport system substrate-binding protein